MTPKEIALLILIGQHPNLRTMQLADRLDLTVDDVDALLRPHLVAGNVVEDELVAPNQRPAMAYALSEQFKASDAFRTMMVRRDQGEAAAPPQPAGVQDPSITVDDAVAEGDDQPEAPAQSGTKIDRAIALVKSSGFATNGQLRVALGLNKGQYPVNFLGRALVDGRLARDGEDWILGAALAPEQPGMAEAAPKADIAIPRFDTIGARGLPARQEPRCSPAEFRCAVWSDGIFEMQRGGVTFASLSPAERNELEGFILSR